MKILFDQGTPVPLIKHLPNYIVNTAFEMGWAQLTNGDLLKIAEQKGYDLLITTDQNIRYQQNLSERKIAILVLKSTSWPRIQLKLEDILKAVSVIKNDDYVEIGI